MNTISERSSRRTKWAAAILTAMVTAPFVLSAVMKLLQIPAVMESFAKAGIPAGAAIPIGILELFCAALFVIRRTAVLGSLLLTGYLGGAILTNIVMRTDFTLPVALGLFVWAATWLRVEKLGTFIPIYRFSVAPRKEV